MEYCVETKSTWHAKPICGSDAFLRSCEDIPGIDGAEWIWPHFYTRGLLCCSFEIDAPVEQATAHFICDNGFDLYCNKAEVAHNVKACETDISELLRVGTNTINLRTFQTDCTDYFTSAVCGEIVIINGGVTKRIVTDHNTWKNMHPVLFDCNDEPENWMDGNGQTTWLFGKLLHPRQVKRSMYMRKTLTIQAPVQSAVLSVYAAGEADLFLNGEKIGDEVLSQGVSERYREYHCFDVSATLRPGKNVLGAVTANTWLNSASHTEVFMHKNSLLAELAVTYNNGSTEFFGTDSSWKTAPSPITDNDLQFGERYDARLEIQDWCSPTLNDATWADAEELPDDCKKPYVLRGYPPVRVQALLQPVSVTERADGILFDFGVNSAGKYRLSLQNALPGQTVIISVCEQLNPDGSMDHTIYQPVFFPEDCGQNGRARAAVRNYDVYICRGGHEIYAPHFGFNGFRYILVSGCTRAQIQDLRLTVMYNDVTQTGTLSSRDQFYSELFDTVKRTMHSNLFNGFLDCPTREKNFWTGDTMLFSVTACYLADCHGLLARWTDGGRKMCANVYGWGDEIYAIPLTLYRFYGDTEILRIRYSEILAFAYNRMEQAQGGLPVQPKSPFNDHLSPFNKNLPGDFFGCAFYCYMLKSVAEIAEILKDTAVLQKFTQLYRTAAEAFNRRYFIPAEQDYSPHSQSGLVLPLAFGLVPAGQEAAVAARLNRYITEAGCLTTGYIGTRYLMQVLCDYGYTETAAMLLAKTDYPSWRHLLSTGATTLTESWKGMSATEAGGSSKNHFALGTVVGWMFEYLGGIRYRQSAPGFTQLVLQPCPIRQMGSFSCTYQSAAGKIESAWEYTGGDIVYTLSSETTVTLILPDGTKTKFSPGQHSVRVANRAN